MENIGILTVKDIQGILHIGQVTAYKLVRSRAFPVRKVGKCYRIPEHSFMAWLKQEMSAEQIVGAEFSQQGIDTSDSCILSQIRNGGIFNGNKK